jgi:hypothetical protein
VATKSRNLARDMATEKSRWVAPFEDTNTCHPWLGCFGDTPILWTPHMIKDHQFQMIFVWIVEQ